MANFRVSRYVGVDLSKRPVDPPCPYPATSYSSCRGCEGFGVHSSRLERVERCDWAEPLYEAFCEALRELGIRVATGRFGAYMSVEIENDGPVTIVLEV